MGWNFAFWGGECWCTAKTVRRTAPLDQYGPMSEDYPFWILSSDGCRAVMAAEQWWLQSSKLASQIIFSSGLATDSSLAALGVHVLRKTLRWWWHASPLGDLLTRHVSILASAALTWSCWRTCDSDHEGREKWQRKRSHRHILVQRCKSFGAAF